MDLSFFFNLVSTAFQVALGLSISSGGLRFRKRYWLLVTSVSHPFGLKSLSLKRHPFIWRP